MRSYEAKKGAKENGMRDRESKKEGSKWMKCIATPS